MPFVEGRFFTFISYSSAMSLEHSLKKISTLHLPIGGEISRPVSCNLQPVGFHFLFRLLDFRRFVR